MKILLIIAGFLFCSVSNASEFEEAFDMSANGFSREANRIVVFADSTQLRDVVQQQNEFDFVSKSLAEKESDYTNNAVYWFVRGLHEKNLASFYRQNNQPNKVVEKIKKKNKFYLKAMSVDKEHSPDLSARAYSAMKSGLPDESKQQAIAAELGLGGGGESESYYWLLHWSNINELKKLGRMDEANIALANMKKELAASDQKDTFKSLINKIDKEIKVSEKPAPEKKAEKKKEHKAFTEENSDDEYYEYLIIVFIAMLILLVVAGLLEYKRRHNKAAK